MDVKVVLKAYLCATNDPEESEVVFASTNTAARRSYVSSRGDEPENLKVSRAPQFDEHAPGPVPISAYLENGWFHECENCRRVISY